MKVLHLLSTNKFSGAENVVCQIINLFQNESNYKMFYCSPDGEIKETLKNDVKLASEVLEGKNLKVSDLYQSFFIKVRQNKEHHDNLGEELIAVIVHILSRLLFLLLIIKSLLLHFITSNLEKVNLLY